MTITDVAQEPFIGSRRLRAVGWLLHLYTASGTVLALLAVTAALFMPASNAWLRSRKQA